MITKAEQRDDVTFVPGIWRWLPFITFSCWIMNELTFRNCHFAIDNIQFMLSSIIQQLIYVSNWQSLFKMFLEWKISIWPPRSFSLASRRLLNIIMQEKEFFCIKRNYWNLFKFKKELEEIGIIINRETVGLALLHLRDDSP